MYDTYCVYYLYINPFFNIIIIIIHFFVVVVVVYFPFQIES